MKILTLYCVCLFYLYLQLSESSSSKRKSANIETPKLPPSTKLLVKNLAFEATPKDLRQLFGTFGQIKSVRMPKKFNGEHRCGLSY